MAAVDTYTASGAKSTARITLDKSVFAVDVKNHELLKSAYITHQANGRLNLAKVKTRGEVVGSTKKPWRQKGTGRARFGSRYNPIWRGGGITFGPTGIENYSKKINVKAKRQALRQALSIANESGKIIVIDTFACKEGKVKPTVALLEKLDATRNVLLVVSVKDELVERATRNVSKLKAVQAKYLNVYDILNADKIIISKKSLDIISDWLGSVK